MTERFETEAEDELYEAVLFYEARDPGVGYHFLGEVERAVGLLKENPELGARTGRKTFRQFVLDRFPYSLIYDPTSDELVILAVAHHSKEPGYWVERV